MFWKYALQLYWNHTSAWVFSCKFSAFGLRHECSPINLHKSTYKSTYTGLFLSKYSWLANIALPSRRKELRRLYFTLFHNTRENSLQPCLCLALSEFQAQIMLIICLIYHFWQNDEKKNIKIKKLILAYPLENSVKVNYLLCIM